MTQPQVERRATRRFSLRLPVAVKHPEKGEISAFTRDVSSRGICFLISTPLVVGAQLEFTLTLPPEITLTEAIRVRCTARVVRVDENAGEGLAVAAVIDRYEFLAER
jgi:hypothetical protein